MMLCHVPEVMSRRHTLLEHTYPIHTNKHTMNIFCVQTSCDEHMEVSKITCTYAYDVVFIRMCIDSIREIGFRRGSKKAMDFCNCKLVQ
jgi:hypothetical protein